MSRTTPTSIACSTGSSDEHSPFSVAVAVSISSGASFVAMPTSSPGTNPIRPVVTVSHRVLPRAPTLPLPTLHTRKGDEPRHIQSPTRIVVHASSVARRAGPASLLPGPNRMRLRRASSAPLAALSAAEYRRRGVRPSARNNSLTHKTPWPRRHSGNSVNLRPRILPAAYNTVMSSYAGCL